MRSPHRSHLPARGCLVIFVLTASAPASAQVQENWIARVDADGRSDAGLFASLDPAGNVIVAGTSATTDSDSEVLVVKHDPLGTTLWTRRITGGSGGDFRPRGLQVDSAGNVFLVGADTSVSMQDSRIVTVKLDQDGLELWRRNFDISGAFDIPAGLVLDGAGGPIVAGHSDRPQPTGDDIFAVVLAYDSGGNMAWQSTDNGRDQEIVYDIARDSSSGAIYVSGSVSGQSNGVQLLRYDADGRRRWARRYAIRNVFTAGETVAVDSSGDVFVAGLYQPFNADNDIQILRVDGDNGRMIWSARYGTPAKKDRVADLATDGVGNAFIAATISGISSDVDRLVLKYHPGGTREWAAVYDRAGQYDNALALAVDPAGDAYVTGISYEFNGTTYDGDWATTRYSSSGELVWTAIYDGTPFSPAGDMPSAVVLGPGSEVVVTGGIQGDVVTVEYGQP